MVNKVNIKTAIYHKIVTNYTKITVFHSVEEKKNPLLWVLNILLAVVLVMIFWLSLSDPCRTAVPLVLTASVARLGVSVRSLRFSEALSLLLKTLANYEVPQLRQVAEIILVL